MDDVQRIERVLGKLVLAGRYGEYVQTLGPYSDLLEEKERFLEAWLARNVQEAGPAEGSGRPQYPQYGSMSPIWDREGVSQEGILILREPIPNKIVKKYTTWHITEAALGIPPTGLYVSESYQGHLRIFIYLLKGKRAFGKSGHTVPLALEKVFGEVFERVMVK